MKYGYLNCMFHSLSYPAEVFLWEKNIDARSSRVSAFPWKAKGSDASENAFTYQRASRISLGENKRNDEDQHQIRPLAEWKKFHLMWST